MKPKFSDAVLAIIPDAEFVCSSTEILNWYDQRSQPSNDEINSKLSELIAEWDNNQYQNDRLQEYPSIQECIHAILDDDLEALQAKRSAVKAKYPKPE